MAAPGIIVLEARAAWPGLPAGARLAFLRPGSHAGPPRRWLTARKPALFCWHAARLQRPGLELPPDPRPAEVVPAAAHLDLGLLRSTDVRLIRTEHVWTVAAEWAEAQRLASRSQDLAAILDDLCGDPFTPWPDYECWCAQALARGGLVLQLAEQVYADDDWGAVGIVADALEDVMAEADAPGRPDVLDHLRGPGVHVRGCWALDFLRGLPE